jgi:hypothetical protein
MPAKLKLVAILLALLASGTARAQDSLIVVARFGTANRVTEEMARDRLSQRLTHFSNWIDQQPGEHRRYRSFEVRESARANAPNVVVILDGQSTGDATMRTEARIDIGSPQALSVLNDGSNRFRPVIGVMRRNTYGPRGAVIGMYEAFIIYGLLVRALEDGARNAARRPNGMLSPAELLTLTLLHARLDVVRRDTLVQGGASLACLGLLDRSTDEIARRAREPFLARRFRTPPPKDFVC